MATSNHNRLATAGQLLGNCWYLHSFSGMPPAPTVFRLPDASLTIVQCSLEITLHFLPLLSPLLIARHECRLQTSYGVWDNKVQRRAALGKGILKKVAGPTVSESRHDRCCNSDIRK